MTDARTTSGTLYIVATPIGNLEDITLRALRILKEVKLIAAEDTRHTRNLLNHFGIGTPLISYYREKEAERAEEILQRLGNGEDIALVSDAGTPGISDPGAVVVRAARAGGFRVVTSSNLAIGPYKNVQWCGAVCGIRPPRGNGSDCRTLPFGPSGCKPDPAGPRQELRELFQSVVKA